MLNPYLFDTRGFDTVRQAIEPPILRDANALIDKLGIWERITAAGPVDDAASGWRVIDDELTRYICPIGSGHIQVGPITAWPEPVASLVAHPAITAVFQRLFPDGYYVDHAVLSMATKGSPGIELHGGAHERDLRQSYRFGHGQWDVGLSVVVIHLTPHSSRKGGTALVPGSHKANLMPSAPLPPAGRFAEHHWIVGEDASAGDVLVFPEALMHGAFPWLHDWERRNLIIKAYPSHLANLFNQPRSAEGQFWPARREPEAGIR